MPSQPKINYELIEFVRKTTEAITVISETTKEMKEITNALKDQHSNHNNDMKVGFTETNTKLEGLKMLFVYVIIPLIGGILALVGVKFIFDIPIK